MPSRCCEFVDSRLRRSPPDRTSAVPYGQAGENAMRFPHLAHRSAAAHKLHSTPQQDGMNLFRGIIKPAAGYPLLAYSSPEAVQTTGTVAPALEGRVRCRIQLTQPRQVDGAHGTEMFAHRSRMWLSLCKLLIRLAVTVLP